MSDDMKLLQELRRLAQHAWPNWFRSAGAASPQPRVFCHEPANRVEIDAIRALEARRTVAIRKGRHGEAELIEKRQRERMVDLVTRRPDGVERVIFWLSDVAEAADMLGQKRTIYAKLVEQAHLHSIATLADRLFMHALPLLMEQEDTDLTALAKRVARCKPGVRLASVDGPPKCPLGGRQPTVESYEQRSEKARARWRAKKGKGKPYGATGPRPGSLNAARLQIRDTGRAHCAANGSRQQA
jgi:hypothetical protein